MWTLLEHGNHIIAIVAYARLPLVLLDLYCQSLALEMWMDAWKPEETVTDETDKPEGGGMGECGQMQVDRWLQKQLAAV